MWANIFPISTCFIFSNSGRCLQSSSRFRHGILANFVLLLNLIDCPGMVSLTLDVLLIPDLLYFLKIWFAMADFSPICLTSLLELLFVFMANSDIFLAWVSSLEKS